MKKHYKGLTVLLSAFMLAGKCFRRICRTGR